MIIFSQDYTIEQLLFSNPFPFQTLLFQNMSNIPKVFIWRGVMCGCYTSGIVVASGETKDGAIDKVIAEFNQNPTNKGTWNGEDDEDYSGESDRPLASILRSELMRVIPEEKTLEDLVCWQGGGD